jgi:predicted RNA-binding protein with PUA-like domain
MAERRYWLMKSEPNTYSFDDLMSEEDQTAEWDGVRSYQARNTMRDDMKEGDVVLFYHSNAKPNAVVGTAIVVRGGYPDHTAWDPDSHYADPKSTPENPIWYMVDIKADRKFDRPVSLPDIKASKDLENMVLVKNSRLSVQPVTPEEFETVVRMGAGEA